MEWQCHAQFTLEALDKVFFFCCVRWWLYGMAGLVTLCLDRTFEMQNKGVCSWLCRLVAVSFMTESEALHFFCFGAVW